MRPSPGTPGSLITAAVLLFSYGGLLMVCGVCGAASVGGNLALKGQGGPDQQRLEAILEKEAPGHQIIQYANVVLNLLIGVVMVGAGIGVLKWSQLGRLAAYLAIVLELLLSFGVKIYQTVFIMPVTRQFFDEIMKQQQNKGAPPPPFDMGAMVTGVGAATTIMILLVQVSLLITALICLSTPTARAAFAGTLGADDPRFDDERPRQSGDGYDEGYNDGYGSPKAPKNPGDTGIQQ